MLHQLEDVFQIIVQYVILFMELAGVIVLLVTAVKALYIWAVKKERVQLNLAQGIALALEFKLGSEVLRTVIVREQGEMLMLGLIILLRGALTFLIHWEIKGEESRLKKEERMVNTENTEKE